MWFRRCHNGPYRASEISWTTDAEHCSAISHPAQQQQRCLQTRLKVEAVS